MEVKTIARVNNVCILVLSDDIQELVPINPICEAMGVDEDAQRRKLQEDDFLGSTAVLSTVTGSDGMQHKMVCFPYEYIFEWILSIDTGSSSRDGQREASSIRTQCYNALLNYIHDRDLFLKQKQITVEYYSLRFEEAETGYIAAKAIKKQEADRLQWAENLTFEEWREMGGFPSPAGQGASSTTGRAVTGDSFTTWADNYFSIPGRLNARIPRKEMQENFFRTIPGIERSISSNIFKKKLREYCERKGYVINPHMVDPISGLAIKWRNGKPITDDKSGSAEYFTIVETIHPRNAPSVP